MIHHRKFKPETRGIGMTSQGTRDRLVERLRSNGIRDQRVLGNTAADWLSADRDPSFLLRGSKLDQFAAWAESTDLILTQVEQDYIEACLAERHARETAQGQGAS